MKLKDIVLENKITSFEEIKDRYVGGDFVVLDRRIPTLKGCPQHITGKFDVTGNVFTSLKYAPTKVDGDFICLNNGGFIDFSDMGRIQANTIKISGKNRDNMRQWTNFATLLRNVKCDTLNFSIYSMPLPSDKSNLNNFLRLLVQGNKRKNNGEDIDEICADIAFWCADHDLPFDLFGE